MIEERSPEDETDSVDEDGSPPPKRSRITEPSASFKLGDLEDAQLA
jgi:hypothetical protein